MTSRRATRRRRLADARKIPVVPGVVPDLSDESKARAAADAHRVLPKLRGTTVTLRYYPPAEGLALVDEHFTTTGAGDAVRHHLTLAVDNGATDPHIVIASREFDDQPDHHHERPNP